MAVTRLTDVIEPSVFARYMFKDTAEKARIFTSGIMSPDASLAAFLAGGGATTNLP